MTSCPNGHVRLSKGFRPAVNNHPGTDRIIRQTVNDDKGTGRAVLTVRIKGKRLFELKCTPSDFIEGELSGVLTVEGIHVHTIPHLGNHPRRCVGGVLDKILLARLHGLFSHPHQHGLKARGYERHIVGMNEHISATDVDFVFKRQGHGQRRHGLLQFPLKGMDGFHPACFA